MGRNKVPDGWLGCPKNGNHLIATKFMTLKTPLSDRYDAQLSPSELFHPEDIFSKAHRNRVKIGLWLDLTNTSRYYSEEDIIKQDCIYEKIQCEGFGRYPSSKDINRFNYLVHQFITRNPHICIAVHCTHGFNRTGFMIVTFLIEKMNYRFQDALELFQNARYMLVVLKNRPPGIYRANYLEELFKRYGGRVPPTVPVLPAWCPPEDKKKRKRGG